ncbi:MAG: pyridoxamine 5'-phosphate oxidase family protein [Methanotrichaceae archaeon]|nr:pyridoxamine 5'-phosphate oxidase family protein [Methanotrichaceae archaeon]
MPGKLMEYFNKQPRLGVISTSNKDGKVDCAVYGSPQMIDEKTVIVALARGRTFANLQENPHAVFMIMEPEEGVLDWKGVRVYLRMQEFATSGPKLDAYKSQIARIVGEQAAEMIAVLATFEVMEVRPLIDYGQGWEMSI